ncbi:MAG: head-tail connector protein [Pseudomonadota bacterium]
MMLNEETTVPDAALPVAAFKAHLRLGSGFGDDSLQDAVLISFLRAAVTAVEARTGKVLFERDFALTVTEVSGGNAVAIPVAPLLAISSVSVVDASGNETEIAADQFWAERDVHRPRLRSVGHMLPTIPTAGSMIIAFSAGHGVGWADIPADLQQAVLLLAAHYYEFRHETTLSEGCMPFGVTSLIERYRPIRLGGSAK